MIDKTLSAAQKSYSIILNPSFESYVDTIMHTVCVFGF